MNSSELIYDEFKKIGSKKIKTEKDKQQLVALHSMLVENKNRLLSRPYRANNKRLEISKEIGLKSAKLIAQEKHCPYRNTLKERLSLSDNYFFEN
jgi:hypothetical protein